jgi:hypothetical protein
MRGGQESAASATSRELQTTSKSDTPATSRSCRTGPAGQTTAGARASRASSPRAFSIARRPLSQERHTGEVDHEPTGRRLDRGLERLLQRRHGGDVHLGR